MPPRVQLNDADAARLTELLRAAPRAALAFPRDGSNLERAVWVLGAYDDGGPLSPALITWLIFNNGPNLALSAVEAALAQARKAGWARPEGDGLRLTEAGRAHLGPGA